jgi:preprotein translocase subunit YajC
VLAKQLPLIILAVLFVGLIMFNRRNKQRAAAADLARRQGMHPGTQVMTTSGLYGTVISVNQMDGTALLSIAPGVEVKWTVTALREVAELPPQYRDAVESGSAGVDGRPIPGTSADGSDLHDPN